MKKRMNCLTAIFAALVLVVSVSASAAEAGGNAPEGMPGAGNEGEPENGNAPGENEAPGSGNAPDGAGCIWRFGCDDL